jgi:ribosomal protein L17
MPHQIAKKRLSRTDGHRKALLRNLATSFFKHEKIETTTTKAKEVSKVVERLITTARRGDLHSRRLVAEYLTRARRHEEARRADRAGAQGSHRRLHAHHQDPRAPRATPPNSLLELVRSSCSLR